MGWILRSKDDESILREIYTQTDRGAALIAAAYLEERLKQAILARLNRNEKIEERLFLATGPLGSFSVKIDFGYMLGIYHEKVHKDLRTIKDIRNKFAHRAEPLHFDSDGIKDWCKNIYVSGEFELRAANNDVLKFKIEPDGTPRTAFLNAVQFALIVLDTEIRTSPQRTPAPPLLPDFSTQKASPEKP